MFKRATLLLTTFLPLFLLISCSDDSPPKDFQINHSVEFELMEVFTGFGALEDAWDNIDPKGFNERMERAINSNIDEFEIYAYSFRDIIEDPEQPFQKLVNTDVKGTVEHLVDTKNRFYSKENIDSFHHKTGEDYAEDFYSFLDNVTDSGIEVPDGYFNLMNKKVISYMLDSIPMDNEDLRKDWLNDKMDELIEDILDDDFNEDFIDLSKTLSKLLIRTDYSMWIDSDKRPLNYVEINPATHTDLELGNAAKGTSLLAMWLNSIVRNSETREFTHLAIQELANVLGLDTHAQTSKKLRDLICNIEDHFTKGGEVYENNPIYHRDDNLIYSDAQLEESIRETFPHLMQLFIRSDRPDSMLTDKYGQKVYPLKVFVENLKKIKWDPNKTDIEKSINDFVSYDIFGRDRKTDPDAYHTSLLEHLLFFALVAGNFGFTDGGNTGEITDPSHANYNHGHGYAATGATLNDSLFAMNTNKTMGLGMYELSLKPDDKNHIYRSRKPFNTATKDDYRFYFDQNYPIGLFLGGNPGDMGAPDGGINPKHENGDPVLNAYRPYCATGIKDDNVAMNVLSASVRIAWEADGPFYHAPENAPTIYMNDDGKMYNVYYTPAGRVYAYVHKPVDGSDNWEYHYPANDKQAFEDNAYFIGYIQKDIPKTHALFLSDVNLANGKNLGFGNHTLRIQIGDKDNPEIDASVPFPFKFGKYYQQEIVDAINNAVEETVCFAYNVGGKKYIQIKSSNGPIVLSNAIGNPICGLLRACVKQAETVEINANAFTFNDDMSVKISIDDEPEQTVTFSAPHLKLWSIEKIGNSLLNSNVSDHVTVFKNGFIIDGTSNDPEVAKVKIENLPGSNANCVEMFFGGNDDITISRLMRYDRYKTLFRTDYYMSRLSLSSVNDEYYSITRDINGNLKIVNLGADGDAKCLVVEHIMDRTDPVRACSSPEEALFKNYQWFYAERKHVLILPLYLTVPEDVPIVGPLLGGTHLGVVYQVIETNGFGAFMNVRKFTGNHVWVKKGSAGRSDIPGDFRIEVIAGIAPLLDLAFSGDMIYNDTIDSGAAFSAIMASCSTTLYRLSFPRAPKIVHGYDVNGNEISDYLLGPREFEVGDAIWEDRNSILTLLMAFFGGLHDYTQLDGYESKKSGIKQVIDLIPILIKPLWHYQKATGAFPRKVFCPRIIDDNYFLESSANFYNNNNPLEDWYGSDYERRYFLPAMAKTLVNMLIDKDITNPEERNNGILFELTDTKFITNMLNILLSDTNNSEILYSALEQIVSSIKVTKGEYTKITEGKTSEDSYYQNEGSYKEISFPNWMFATGVEETKDVYGKFTEFTDVRSEDLILDEVLDIIIGHDEIDSENSGYGLADYPDDKFYDEDWLDFNDDIEVLSNLFHEDSKYCITQNLLDMSDRVMGKDRPYTADEISGLLYSSGKLFSYYDTQEKRWVHQGEDGFNDIYNMIRLRLPEIHDIIIKDEVTQPGTDNEPDKATIPGDNYYSHLVILSNIFDEDGLAEFLLNTVTVPWSWEKIVYDLEDFLGSEIIVDPDSPLWPTLADLLSDMGKAAGEAKNEIDMGDLYEEYGFQVN